mgnify:CR=1 FL=1
MGALSVVRVFRFFAGPIFAGLAVGLAVLWWYEWGPSAQPARHDTGVASYAGAVTHAAPAVVNIFTSQVVTSDDDAESPLFNRFMEQPRRERALSSLGSGVIVDDAGYVLTSHHVIRDADEILVALRDGRDAPARVVGADPETDLALLHIALENLPEVELNGNGPVQVGDVVLAIGNPLGVGQTVSMGIVSATGRSHLGIATFENFIQTDAAINQGNSGGALIDAEGNLIGINTAIIRGRLASGQKAEGIGFAVVQGEGLFVGGFFDLHHQHIVAAIGDLADANHAFNGSIFRHLELVATGHKFHGADKACGIACSKKLLRVGPLAAGTAHFFRGCQLYIKNAV